MAKIFSSELHGNENASIQFGAAIVNAVRDVRQSIAHLAKSRKADEYAPGAIHALRKLCEGESGRCTIHIHRKEVEEWQDCFAAWFGRVKGRFPKEHVERFQANADDDFRVILESSRNVPESYWRDEVDERDIRITFKSEEALKAAREAAEEKHPVDLGSALHKYIDRCLAALVEEPADKRPKTARLETAPPADSLVLRISRHDDGTISLCLDHFHCFDSADDLAQDIVTTAYDVEDAVQSYVADNCDDVADDLNFDCESSMFCVRSRSAKSMAIVAGILFHFAADQELYVQYRGNQ